MGIESKEKADVRRRGPATGAALHGSDTNALRHGSQRSLVVLARLLGEAEEEEEGTGEKKKKKKSTDIDVQGQDAHKVKKRKKAVDGAEDVAPPGQKSDRRKKRDAEGVS